MCIQIFPTIVLTFDCRLSLVGKPKGRIAKKEVTTLPDGAYCMSLVQPVDGGYNKAFKAQMRAEYTEWMLGQDPNKPIPTTSRRQLATWIISAQKNVGAETIRNAWRKTGLSYYPI